MQMSWFVMSFFLLGCGKNQSIAETPAQGTIAKVDVGDVTAKTPKIETLVMVDDKVTEPKVTEKIIAGNQERLFKSTVQLTSAVENCVGQRQTIIQNGMLYATDKSKEENKVTFLSMPASKSGKDIIQTQALSFDGEAVLLASSVRTANLNLSYLLALRNVANVVAVNCAAKDPATMSNMCVCNDAASANAMLKRCLPHVAPDLLKQQVEPDFMAACQKDPKVAISSLIGSPQFARFD